MNVAVPRPETGEIVGLQLESPIDTPGWEAAVAKSRSTITFTDEERNYAEVVTEVVAQIIPGLALALAPRTEVLLHDLTKFPNSIVAISNSLTGRSVGGPPTDLGMQVLANPVSDDMIGYRTRLESGLTLRSSSVFFRYSGTGRTVAALCMNADITDIMRVQEVLATMSLPLPAAAAAAAEPRETFPSSVEMLTQGILADAMSSIGVGVDLMKKAHKKEVVRLLDERGFFTLRESVDIAAKGLGVSRYTVYNYLKELQSPADIANSDR